MNIRKIAILGGGTSGWLAANHLGRELSHNSAIQITLLESPDIPTIGVGEGTVPSIRNSLQSFGISESEFIRTCDVTFKQGIKFVDWLNPDVHGVGDYYYHPFDYPYPFGLDLVPYWLSAASDARFSDIACVQGRVCDASLAPKRINMPEYQGETTYAYHLNALKFAKLLKENAVKRFGVCHEYATIVGASKSPDGAIRGLIRDDGEELEFDFFVDCSGFSSLLLGRELSVPFVDKSQELLTDTALTMQVETEADSEIPSVTIATAHKAGWIWDIALTNRRGTGFVYSSSHMSDSEAAFSFARYLNVDIDNFSPRKIPIKVGYREKFWHKNCVAIGLSQGFVEPLEATSILVTDFAAQYLARSFPSDSSDFSVLSDRYNRVLGYSWDRVIDFIKVHYCLSDRDDSDFWIDNRRPETISDTLRDRLKLWSIFHPKVTDFFSKFEIFDVENYLYVLYGMKFFTKPPEVPPIQVEQSAHCAQSLMRHANQLLNQLPENRELLAHIAKHGQG